MEDIGKELESELRREFKPATRPLGNGSGGQPRLSHRVDELIRELELRIEILKKLKESL